MCLNRFRSWQWEEGASTFDAHSAKFSGSFRRLGIVFSTMRYQRVNGITVCWELAVRSTLAIVCGYANAAFGLLAIWAIIALNARTRLNWFRSYRCTNDIDEGEWYDISGRRRIFPRNYCLIIEKWGLRLELRDTLIYITSKTKCRILEMILHSFSEHMRIRAYAL